MRRTFRVTYLRTVYREVEILADDRHKAEGLFELMAADSPEMALEQGRSLTKPRYRAVDFVPVDPVDLKNADERRPSLKVATASRTAVLPNRTETAA